MSLLFGFQHLSLGHPDVRHAYQYAAQVHPALRAKSTWVGAAANLAKLYRNIGHAAEGDWLKAYISLSI